MECFLNPFDFLTYPSSKEPGESVWKWRQNLTDQTNQSSYRNISRASLAGSLLLATHRSV